MGIGVYGRVESGDNVEVILEVGYEVISRYRRSVGKYSKGRVNIRIYYSVGWGFDRDVRADFLELLMLE